MLTAADLPETLALFPLSGVLLLPRARLPLHIFEPRYLAMLDDTLRTSHRLIGMVQPIENSDMGLHKIGCAGRLTSFTEMEDGRYMASLTGISRFRIEQNEEGFAPYRKAKVTWHEFSKDLEPDEENPDFDRAAFVRYLERFFAQRSLSTDWEIIKEAEDEMLINSLSMLCPFKPEDKQALLEAPTLKVRRETLQTLIEFALRAGSSEEIMQ